MSTSFFTNFGDNTLLNKFKGIFEHNKDIEYFRTLVVSGYFSIRIDLTPSELLTPFDLPWYYASEVEEEVDRLRSRGDFINTSLIAMWFRIGSLRAILIGK